jgi:3-deoxy-manno-octulosonate cytidylyltransferase (CMP-KDO synthetase)
MTAVEHTSGTDRIAEVAKRLGWADDVVIVGLQGDEPATPADHLNRLAANLREHTDADMATLCLPITSRADYDNPDRVKVVRDARGMALYFSRASIPRRRGTGRDVGDNTSGDANQDTNHDASGNAGFPSAFLHVGLYAYRCAYLQRYSALTPSDAEQEEQLEQLRVLHHGGRIHVAELAAAPAHGVDRPEDVAAIERLLASFDT